MERIKCSECDCLEVNIYCSTYEQYAYKYGIPKIKDKPDKFVWTIICPDCNNTIWHTLGVLIDT